MEALIAAFLESLMPEMAKTAAAEVGTGAVADIVGSAATDVAAGAIPQVAAASPMSMGQAAGNFATNAVNQQVQPAMNLYNQVTAPNATAGDMARSAFEYSIKTDQDPQNQVKIPAMASMNPYANMTNNTAGGIPSLLQNTQSGLLPYFGAR